MAGKKFLNSYLKIAICVLGMAIMAYFLWPAIQEGKLSENLTMVRGLVFLGFGYLLVQSVRELI